MSDAQRTTVVPPLTLGWRLQMSLGAANLKPGQMADYFDVEGSTVSRWLHDKTTPSKAVVMQWALRTGVPYEWLATGSEPETGPPDGGVDLDGRPTDRSDATVLQFLAHAS